jgi:hypothetical protein
VNLLTGTCVNIEKYGGQGEVQVSSMVVIYKYQTNTRSTGGNGYGLPQSVAERCDVMIPCDVVFVRWTMYTLVLEFKFTVVITVVRSDCIQIWLHLTERCYIKLLSLL